MGTYIRHRCYLPTIVMNQYQETFATSKTMRRKFSRIEPDIFFYFV